MILHIFIDLTNVHISYNPLQLTDNDFFQKYKNRLLEIGSIFTGNRQSAQKGIWKDVGVP